MHGAASSDAIAPALPSSDFIPDAGTPSAIAPDVAALSLSALNPVATPNFADQFLNQSTENPSPTITVADHPEQLQFNENGDDLGFAELFKLPKGEPIVFNRAKIKDIGTVSTTPEGKPKISFSSAEVEYLAAPFKLALVGRFSKKAPSRRRIQKALGKIKLSGSFTWAFLSDRHILIQPSEACDRDKLLNGVDGLPVWDVEGSSMHVFPWTPAFRPDYDTSSS